jgi:predicted amidohydrolase YtcJ
MFQGTIEIHRGRITRIKPDNGYLNIFIDGKLYEFGNSFAYPGFVDSHLHLLSGGELLFMPDLSLARSAEECVDIVFQSNFRRGNWIFARGWNQDFWTEKSFPTKRLLDEKFPDKPACLIRQDGHCIWLNSRAMEICNINSSTPDPEGGKIVKDSNGEPTGILIDNAIDIVRNYLPEYSEQHYLKFLEKSIQKLSSLGITAVHDMDVSPKYLAIYEKYFSNNDTKKINVRIFLSGKEIFEMGTIPKFKNDYCEVVGLKFYMDGAFGSFGALLSEPYSDHPYTKGLQLISEDNLNEYIYFTAKNNLGIAIHSIGDKATSIILQTYRKYLAKNLPKPKFFRIEHCQIVQPSDIPLFKELDVVASVQPSHFVSDYAMAKSRLGSRTKFAYPWKSFLDLGTLICAGSDFPVENPNPLMGIDAFINRRSFDLEQKFADETIPLDLALKSYTSFPRISLGEKEIQISSGNEGTLTILDTHFFETPKTEIRKAKVVATIVKGNLIYQAG